MASSLLALLDDITSVLDDVALLSKVAAKKTVGVLGDDLALNAQQVSGVHADRELPVVWAVAKGSLVNKAILVPAALAISAFAPWAVTPLLMVGGAFLCFEGFEKLSHRWLARHDAPEDLPAEAAPAPVDLKAFEKDKVKGAIRTDFILSAEIIAIALGTVQGTSFVTQVAVMSGIALAMTVGVYGFVGGIVKLDDAGLYLSRLEGSSAWRSAQRGVGRGILRAAPWLMKALSVAGTVAMFLVGGGILVHGLRPWAEALEHVAENAGGAAALTGWPGGQAALSWLALSLMQIGTGLVAGAAALGIVLLVKKLVAPGGAASAKPHRAG
jgi:uncharacterized protein